MKHQEFRPGKNPEQLFMKWYEEALKRSVPREAMMLSTVSNKGQPSSRMVLLKGFHQGCFCFFTNYQSRKAHELQGQPKASLLFFWPAGKSPLGHHGSRFDRQVRVEGRVIPMSREESEAYFATRPRGAQLGAWASHQSQPIKNSRELRQRVTRLETVFEGQEIPCPPYWGGLVLVPERFEFWEAGLDRIHTRFEFKRAQRKDGGRSQTWKVQQLSP